MKAERSAAKESIGNNVPSMSADRARPSNRRSKSAGGSGGIWNIVFGLVVVMLVGALYFLWSEYEVTRQEMQRANDRITSLEGQLASTGDEMSQSDAAVRVQLKGLDKEVRRLEQNRKKDKELLLQHEKSVKNLTTRTSNTKTKQSALVSQTTSLSAALDEVVETIDSVDFDTLSDQLNAINILKQRLADMESKQSEINERLDANDAFRRQANARLGAIENPASSAPQLQ